MAVPYIDLFNLVYSTTISESVKDEIINHIELPVTESATEFSEDVYESLVFLDNMAYSGMSESVVNELIDKVFDGCSEEYLEEVYEAYIRAKALAYICEDDSPESWNSKTYKKNITTPRAIKELEDKAKARQQGNFLSKAKEGIKNAVSKVKNWWDRQSTKNQPKVEASKPARVSFQDKKAQLKAKRRYADKLQKQDDYDVKQYANQVAQSFNRKPALQDLKNKSKQAVKNATEPKKEEVKPEVKAEEVKPEVKEEPKNNDEKIKQLSFLTKTGKIAKKYQQPQPAKEVVAAAAKKEEKPAESKKEEEKPEVKAEVKEEPKPAEEVVAQAAEEPKVEVKQEKKKTTKAAKNAKKTIEASANGEGNNSQNSNSSTTATITEPKEEVSETPTDTAQDTSTNNKEQTSTSDTAETVVGGKPGSNNKSGSNNNSENSNEGDKGDLRKKFTPGKFGKLRAINKSDLENAIQDIKDRKEIERKEEEKEMERIRKGGTTGSRRYDPNFTAKLVKAKTPEERKKLIEQRKKEEEEAALNAPKIKAENEKFFKNLKKHRGTINSLNKQQSKLEKELKKKNISDEDKAKYEAKIKKIEGARHKLLYG